MEFVTYQKKKKKKTQKNKTKTKPSVTACACLLGWRLSLERLEKTSQKTYPVAIFLSMAGLDFLLQTIFIFRGTITNHLNTLE